MSKHKYIHIVVLLAVVLILLSHGYIHSVAAHGEKRIQVSKPVSDPFFVTQVLPSNASHNVLPDTVVTVTFNRAIDFTTVNSRTFALRGSLTGEYSGTYNQTNNSVQFKPSQYFKGGKK